MKVHVQSQYKIHTIDDIPMHTYFVIEAIPSLVYIKLEAPGAFAMVDAHVEFRNNAFFKGKQLRQVEVRECTVVPRKVI